MGKVNITGEEQAFEETVNATPYPENIAESSDFKESGMSAYEEKDSANAGLSKEELDDPNNIKVTIDDDSSPIVVLFGPPSCGKTMTLIRLTRYLSQIGFTVSPVKTFRPSYDQHYKELCDGFNGLVDSDSAALSNTRINFMLLSVFRQGHPVCQILEAPGEHYYVGHGAAEAFPNYISNIIQNNNRKIWLFMVEPDWKDSEDRDGYVSRIRKLKSKIDMSDKGIFVFNKVDGTNYVISKGKVNQKEAFKFVQKQYKGIFEPFRNENPITRFFRKYRCAFVPFSTGTFHEKKAGGLSYEQGPDAYPRQLWNVIAKSIKG